MGISPNDEAQRTKQGPDEVVAEGFLCCKRSRLIRGTVGRQTALMCAAKGASVSTLMVSSEAPLEPLDE